MDHGVGSAIERREDAQYDRRSGQPLTGSFMDYAMLRASDLPMLDCAFADGPAGENPLGMKDIGEAGATGSATAAG